MRTVSVPISAIGGPKRKTTDNSDGHGYVACIRSQLLLAILAVVVGTLFVERVRAQVRARELAERLNVTDEEIAQQVKEWTGPLYEHLPLEVRFAREVCELNADQAVALETAGRDAIARIADEIASSMQKNHRFRRVQVVVRANGDPAVVPGGGVQPARGWPHMVLRHVLMEALQVRSGNRGPLHPDSPAWPDVGQRIAAEQRQLDELQTRASVLVKVAALDEALLLTSDQRTRLCQLLTRDGNESPPQMAHVILAVGPLERLCATLAGGTFGTTRLPAADWQRVLTAAQLAAYNDSLSPQQEEVVFVRQAAARQAAAGVPNAVRAAAGAGGKAQDAQQLQALQKLQTRQMLLAQQQLQMRILRQGPQLEDALRQLNRYLQQRMDEIDAACHLTNEQREKLRLAGKLDLVRFQKGLPSPEKPAEGEELVIQKVQVAGHDLRLPLSVLDNKDSYFQKAVNGRLHGEQKQKLAESARERRLFARQAFIEATVAGFESAAALTARQWEDVSAALSELMSQFDGESHWRVEFLRTIAMLPEEWSGRFFPDFQVPYARLQQAQIGETARQFETREQHLAAPAAAGGGVF